MIFELTKEEIEFQKIITDYGYTPERLIRHADAKLIIASMVDLLDFHLAAGAYIEDLYDYTNILHTPWTIMRYSNFTYSVTTLVYVTRGSNPIVIHAGRCTHFAHTLEAALCFITPLKMHQDYRNAATLINNPELTKICCI